jgi:putative exosortase-associated protein (TIGR04073 family)
MPRKLPLLCLAACLSGLSSIPAAAEDGSSLSYGSKIGGKFLIGMMNATTGIVEIPKTMMTETASDGLAMGMTVGLVKGMTNMLGRSLMGMMDVVSFPIPTKPLIKPPVVFQDFDQETTYGDGWETY